MLGDYPPERQGMSGRMVVRVRYIQRALGAGVELGSDVAWWPELAPLTSAERAWVKGKLKEMRP